MKSRQVFGALTALTLLSACMEMPAPSTQAKIAPPAEATKVTEVAAVETEGAAAEATPEPVVVAAREPGLQDHLDRHGVPLRLPTYGKAILVNIPSYELIALENGEEIFRQKVIVGKPGAKRETPIIDTWTSVARFRPTWRPTPSMIATGAYDDGVRKAGKRNPLGLVALRLEPGMLVYLHDTNKPQLFERSKRALSWGCVRVSDREQLLSWVLDMEPSAVNDLMHGKRTVDVGTEGMPVLLRYYTAFPDRDGALIKHDDIYNRGETVLTPKLPEQRIVDTAPATENAARTAPRPHTAQIAALPVSE